MSESLRKSDSAVEREIGTYLDEHFYPRYFTNHVRVNDSIRQMQGIDVIASYQKMSDVRIDEKAMAHYINKDIPTFAFELSFLVHGHVVPGWLFDSSKLTDYYNLIWIWGKREHNLRKEDIERLEVLFVSRIKLIAMLEGFGLNYSKAFEISGLIRNGNKVGAQFKSSNLPYYFYYSNQLAERPVNIIIKKQKLIEIATDRYFLE